MQVTAGTVVSLWRYRAKSMQGEELNGAVVSATLAPGVVFPAVAGIYTSVLREGVVRRGDPVVPG